MSDLADRLKEQSKFHNSRWVMALLAEAGDCVEKLEQENNLLKTLLNNQCGPLTPQEDAKIGSGANVDPYDEAMKPLRG